MGILSGTGILDGTGILSGTGIIFQSGILVPPSIDPDAAAYIAAVEAAGATVTGAQRTAIDTFYLAAKADSYYTSLKRLYLPIWGVTAANAIDMISLTSGTFNGGVTHGAGFVQGNGTTGYFDFGVSPIAQGLSVGDHFLIALSYTAETDGLECIVGASDGSGDLSLFNYLYDSGTDRINYGAVITTGVIIGSQIGSDKKVFRRLTSGFTTLESRTIAPAGSVSASMYSIARGTQWHCDNKLGLYGIGLGLSAATATNFSTHLKNLWETCTGLTLP